MSLKQFEMELQKGLKSPAYLFYSDDQYLLKEALFSAKGLIPEDKREFSFDSLDCAEPSMSMENAINTLRTVSFFGGRKILAIENANKLKEKDIAVLDAYLAKPVHETLLLLLYMSDKKERGGIKKSHKDAFKGAKRINLDMSDAEIKSWLAERASALGMEMTMDARSYLVGIIGPDAGLLSSELAKLASTGKRRIEQKDIEELSKGDGEFTAFNLAEAVYNKDVDRALRAFNMLSDSNAPEALLGALNWKFSSAPIRDEGYMGRVYALLNEADTAVKSSGGYYPLEYILLRLMKL